MDTGKKPLAVTRSGAATAIVAALAISVPMAQHFEGLITHPNRDPVGILEVCYGETNVPMRVYTPQQCTAMLYQNEARRYAPDVLACSPELADPRRRYQLAAAIDIAYNAGAATYCRSSIRRAFDAGLWAQGCDDFARYTKAHSHGQLIVLKGLLNRRAIDPMSERSTCLKGIS